MRECGVGRCFVGVASCDMSFPCMLSDIPTRDLQLVYIYVLGFILNTSLGFPPQLRDKIRSSSFMAPHPRGSLRAGEALQLLQGGQEQPMEGVEQGQRRELPEGAEESTRKAQRLDEDTAVAEPGTKKSKTLYPPTFAGQVRQVIQDVEIYEIYVDEEPEIEWQVEEEIDLTDYAEKDGPPEVSGEQLEMLDKEAMLKEVEKLKNMEVISRFQQTWQ